ncbi:S-adenosyl-L-methionine-dependent methyltransferase [Massariosphaeria phaeospora]|uniref:S-adenosyl-L-methionine-dependent methyltransferase n=1 Tax=Massariosphaeria phaeospora TaxID=100035 RepID=A0A7C8IAG5_9PLEO|nr:S-adenosyl-L-methionine-dependent methyltransferase [Massariosphaeria phaeospora]
MSRTTTPTSKSTVPTSPRTKHHSPRPLPRTSTSPTTRFFHTTPTPNDDPQKKPTWSADQYLKFHAERTRPVHDLLAQATPLLPPSSSASPLRIFDLGCGPGNSTAVLHSAFPTARLTGIDASSDMLQKARGDASLQRPNIDFVEADLATFDPRSADGEDRPPDLLFSNAAFHWLRSPQRLATITRLFRTLRPGTSTSTSSGGVLALQVPDNFTQPTHALMRRTALLPHKPWTQHFASARIHDRSCATRPDLDPIEPPHGIIAALGPHASSVRVWHTTYYHELADAAAIVAWVRGSGLMPYLERLEGDERAKEGFLAEYEGRVGERYERVGEGRGVLLAYPRLFVVAVRK